jgi:hypothetical protein
MIGVRARLTNWLRASSTMYNRFRTSHGRYYPGRWRPAWEERVDRRTF